MFHRCKFIGTFSYAVGGPGGHKIKILPLKILNLAVGGPGGLEIKILPPKILNLAGGGSGGLAAKRAWTLQVSSTFTSRW